MNEKQELRNLEQVIINKIGAKNLSRYEILKARQRKLQIKRDSKKWFSNRLNDKAEKILREAGRIAERRMNKAFPPKSNKQIMKEAIRVAKNRNRYRPRLSFSQLAAKYGITELSLRNRVLKPR
ncbi:MAG TPA: hypothetical protein VNE86_03340 [Nitrososphaerales archaeon]|nr:hypothetical protein [Nitrososphaerales archaeon]